MVKHIQVVESRLGHPPACIQHRQEMLQQPGFVHVPERGAGPVGFHYQVEFIADSLGRRFPDQLG